MEMLAHLCVTPNACGRANLWSKTGHMTALKKKKTKHIHSFQPGPPQKHLSATEWLCLKLNFKDIWAGMLICFNSFRLLLSKVSNKNQELTLGASSIQKEDDDNVSTLFILESLQSLPYNTVVTTIKLPAGIAREESITHKHKHAISVIEVIFDVFVTECNKCTLLSHTDACRDKPAHTFFLKFFCSSNRPLMRRTTDYKTWGGARKAEMTPTCLTHQALWWQFWQALLGETTRIFLSTSSCVFPTFSFFLK